MASKLTTGIESLDAVLKGGLPKDRLILVRGGPATGKTLFSFECITLEENAAGLRTNAAVLGRDLPALEDSDRLCILEVDVPTTAVCSGDFDIQGLLAILDGRLQTAQAARPVIDLHLSQQY